MTALVAAHAMVVFICVWAFHGFRFAAFHPRYPGLQLYPRSDFGGEAMFAGLISWARRVRLLPEAYLFGFSHVFSGAAARRA